MPFADDARRREYMRAYMRMRRAAERKTGVKPVVPAPIRVETAQQILELLAEQINDVRADASVGTVERARAIGYLAGVALRAVEVADLAARVEALEQALEAEKAAAG